MSSLLPPNATTGELALEASISRPLDVLVGDVWRPDACLADLLPWLAWGLSVDSWNPAWTEEQKRGAISASVDVHKKKGTVGAVKDAVAGIGYEIDTEEWFQMEPAGDPYTFAMRVYLEQVGIEDPAVYDDIENLALSAKNLRSHLVGVNTLLTSRGLQYMVGAIWMGETVYLDCEPGEMVINLYSMILD